MNTFLEMQTTLLSDLNVSSNSSLFPIAVIKDALNRSYLKAGGLFRWPILQDSKKTSTGINQEYYDQPQTWRPNSIWKVEVDGVMYGEDPDGSPLTFEDFLLWKADPLNLNSTEKKWAVQWNRFFLQPIPTVAGTNNISIWGIENVVKMVADEDPTIFSYSMPECNEAIVLEAQSILKAKGDQQQPVPKAFIGGTMLISAEAKAILTTAWNKIREESGKYEKNQPMWNVPDYWSKRSISGRTDNIGNFPR